MDTDNRVDGDADFVLTRQSTGDLDFRILVKPEDYGTSPIEIHRRRLSEDHPPLDKMKDDERDKFLRGLLRFAPNICIYDRQIGRAAKDLRRFYAGINWFLDGWKRHRLAGAKRELVEIFTAAPNSLDGNERGHELERKQRENRVARDLVQQDLIEPLSSNHSVTVRLLWKNDPEGIFHARHIQTTTTCVLVERGFDIFRSDRSWQRTIVKCGRADSDHLTECRGLRNA